MFRDTKSPTKQELSDKAAGYGSEMQEIHGELEKTSGDIQILRKLIDEIDPEGATAECMDEAEKSIGRAEDATEQVFDSQDTSLEKVHDENEGYGQEVQERTSVSERNLGKVSDVTAPLTTQEAVNEIRATKEAMVRNTEVLEEVMNRIKEQADHSKQVQAQLRQIREGRG
jgi:hypothetical protein